MQIRGIGHLQDDTIRALYDTPAFRERQCPREIFLTIAHINRLRVHVASKTPTNIDPIARDLFDTLDKFDLNSWVREKKWENVPSSRYVAEIFQVATLLYGILALPQAVVASWAVSAGHGDGTRLGAYHGVRRLYELELIQLLRKTQPMLQHLSPLTWALAVAGVATPATDARNRDWIAQQLFDIWLQDSTDFASIACRNKLRVFWQSGKSAWDECFDEPTPVQ